LLAGVLPDFLFLLVRSPMTTLSVVLIAVVRTRQEQDKITGKIPKIVATFISDSSQGQHTHSAQTNLLAYNM
jgi:hypothetical protein